MRKRKAVRKAIVYGGLGGFALIGILMIALPANARLTWPSVLGVSTAAVSVSVGQGLVVTALLGAFVDYRLKRDLAEDIAEETANRTATAFFNDLLGGGIRGLPDLYYQGMRDLAAADLLALEMTSRVEFRRSPDSSLELRVSHTLSLYNVSSAVVPAKKPWILAIGCREVCFERYDLEIARPPLKDGDLPSITQVHIEADDLSNFVRDRRWSVSLALPVEDDHRFRIPPKATAAAHFTGKVRSAWEGILPIVASCPTLSQTLFLSGDALDDVEVWVQVGRDSDLAPSNTVDGRRYDLGFGVQGTTARLLWMETTRKPLGGPDVQVHPMAADVSR